MTEAWASVTSGSVRRKKKFSQALIKFPTITEMNAQNLIVGRLVWAMALESSLFSQQNIFNHW